MGRKGNALALSRRERWIDKLQVASPLPFQDRLQEERYVRHRYKAQASTLIAWGVFGAVTNVVFGQRFCANRAGQVMQLCFSLRFLALAWRASTSPDRRDDRWCRWIAALQLTGFPLRSLFYGLNLYGLSAPDVEAFQLFKVGPAVMVWECILFQCLEQMRLHDSCLLHATTMLPVAVLIASQLTDSMLGALASSLFFTVLHVAITAVLESANRAKFLKLEERSSNRAAVHSSTTHPESSAVGFEDQSLVPALHTEIFQHEISQPEISLSETSPLPTTALEQTADIDYTHPWLGRDLDDVSDEEFFTWRDKILCERFKGLWFSVTSVFLTIPDGDPDDLPVDVKKRLVEGFQSSHLDMWVVSVTIKRGSLLVDIQIVSLVHSPGDVEDAVSCLPSWQWLKWLDQPSLRELSVQVEPSSGACAACLDNIPVAMLLPETLPGASCPALRVAVEDIPGGLVLRACFQRKSMALSLMGDKGGSKGDAQPEAEACLSMAVASVAEPSAPATSASAPTTSVVEPTAAVAYSQPAAVACLSVAVPTVGSSLELPGLLSLEARCVTTRLVVDVAPILLLPSCHSGVATELSSGRRTVRACDEPDERGLVGSLGWWLALIRSDHYKVGNVSESERQLARNVGARLLWLLITQGRVSSACMLLSLLLSSGTFARLQDLNTGLGHPQKRSLMHLAALSGSRKMVEEVLLWCTSYELELEWTALDSQGLSPLHLFAMNDEAKVLTWLLPSYPDALSAWNSAEGGMSITPARLARNVSRHTAPAGRPIRTRMVVATATVVRRVEMKAIANNSLMSAAGVAPWGSVTEGKASGPQLAPNLTTVASADQRVLGPMDLLRAEIWGFTDPIREAQYVAVKAIKLSNSLVMYCHCCIWVLVAFLFRYWDAGLLSSFTPANAVACLLLRVAVIAAVKNKNHGWAAKLCVMAWFLSISAVLTTPFEGAGMVGMTTLRSMFEPTLFLVHSPLAVLSHVELFLSSAWYVGTVYGHSVYTVAWSLVVQLLSLLVHTGLDYRCRQTFLATLGSPGASSYLKEE